MGNWHGCVITVGRRHNRYDKWRAIRGSEMIIVYNTSRAEAKKYVEREHLPNFIRDGEVVKSITAKIIPTAKMMEMRNQRRLI